MNCGPGVPVAAQPSLAGPGTASFCGVVMGLCEIDPIGAGGYGGSSGSRNTGRDNIQTISLGDTVRIASDSLELDGVTINNTDFAILFAVSDQLFDNPILELLYLPDEHSVGEYSVGEYAVGEYAVGEYAVGEYDDTGWVTASEGQLGITSGVVSITLNPAFTETLRRGSYIYSLRATNLATGFTGTLFSGSLLVRYSPTGPHRNIPYKRVRVTNEYVESIES